jgi:hypothetical protein
MGSMSKPKETVPVANLVLLVDALQAYTETLRTVVQECYDADLPGVLMDGWPTTAAAVLQIQKQCGKFVSRTSKMQLVDPYKLLLPGQDMPNQRKPKVTPKQVDAKVAKKLTKRKP